MALLTRRERGIDPKPLEPGSYIAKCKDSTEFAALANGHANVWPEAKMIVRNGVAKFFLNEEEVWQCTAYYAASHFLIRAHPADVTDTDSPKWVGTENLTNDAT